MAIKSYEEFALIEPDVWKKMRIPAVDVNQNSVKITDARALGPNAKHKEDEP